MIVIVKTDFHPYMRIGDKVEIDKFKRSKDFHTGVGFRVIGVWAEARWFDCSYFHSPLRVKH